VHDDTTAFRYSVHNDRGELVGFVTTDRARSHPDVGWELSRTNGDRPLIFWELTRRSMRRSPLWNETLLWESQRPNKRQQREHAED
jgi:hypothetical protein